MNEDRNTRFRKLSREVEACRLCPRMANSARVLNWSSGSLTAAIVFVGEAPGRLGADKTLVPFHGDQAGHNFEDLLRYAGLSRADAFVTNAVLCNPRDDGSRNSTPIASELGNCSGFLRRQIELVDPRIVVTLGASALRAVGTIESHELDLARSVRRSVKWFGRVLVPLYHPGQRAMVHRSKANQRSDYRFVADELRRLSGNIRTTAATPTRPDVLAVARYFLARSPSLSYFALHKLVYLAEYTSVKITGARLTAAYFIRQKDGPYCTDLQLSRLRKATPELLVRTPGGKIFLTLRNDLFGRHDRSGDLPSSSTLVLDEVLHRFADREDSELKTAVYLTAPMRSILRREQASESLYNAPIDFLSGT